MAADGSAATTTVSGITANAAYRLPAALFDFLCFRPVFGATQGDTRTIRYFLVD
jgi:hypothetical protein